MSAALLEDPTRDSTLQDDLESFLHVLIYAALRYLEHPLTQDDLADFMKQYFDSRHYHKNTTSGGDFKRQIIAAGKISYKGLNVAICPTIDHPLNRFILVLMSWFRAYYERRLRTVEQHQKRKLAQHELAARPYIVDPELALKYAQRPQVVPRESLDDDQKQKEKDMELVSNLETHVAFSEALGKLAFIDDGWPISDKQDHPLPLSKSSKRGREACDAEQSSNKRSKIEPAKAVSTILRRSSRSPRPILRNTIA